MEIAEVEAPRPLGFELCDPNIPSVMLLVTIDERSGGGTRMTVLLTFPTPQAMDELIGPGFDEGMSGSIAEIDDVLARAVPG